MKMAAVRRANAFALKQVANRLGSVLAAASPERIINLVRTLQAVAPNPAYKTELGALARLFEQRHPALDLARRVFTEAAPACRRALVNNLGVNAAYLGWSVRKERLDRGLGAPFLIVISPTMRCNLRCTGCYAWAYPRCDELPFEIVDRVIREAKELGVYFFTISGGEPFLYEGLLDLFATHSDAEFLVYTNGTLIDQELARRLAELGNVAPAISVEGFEAETNARRGPGTWDRLNAAMDNLREAGVIFGFSGTVTRHNVDIITSEELVDYLIGKGCYFGWYFMYIPIGRAPDTSLMPTPEQRQKSRKRIWRWRNEKPIFVADFWNDGYLTGGCMSGGRLYLHITATGDVEPCVFCHFTVDNIKEKSLEQVLESDFFKALRRRFPWTDNLLTPCAIIDNPWVLREAVAEGGARPSHPGAETIITELANDLDAYSERLHAVTEEEGKTVRTLAESLMEPVEPAAG
ncbi:MAG: radical SAM protein [Candidatus Zipacnadales bacterium]